MRFQLARIMPGSDATAALFTESIAIEFGTPHEVLFECDTTLEFGDELRLRNADSSFDVGACVVRCSITREEPWWPPAFEKKCPTGS